METSDGATLRADEFSRRLEEHGEVFSGFVEGVQNEVLNMAAAQATGPQGFVENVQAFYYAVDWSERWIQGVLGFHAFILVLFILTRNMFRFQVGLFAFILILGRLAEFLNAHLHQRWQQFSRQDYFDEHGVFMAIMWAGPLILVGFMQLLNFLHQCFSMLVVVKREQIKRELAAKKRAKKAKNSGAGEESGEGKEGRQHQASDAKAEKSHGGKSGGGKDERTRNVAHHRPKSINRSIKEH